MAEVEVEAAVAVVVVAVVVVRPTVVPLSRYIWSGAAGSPTQVIRRAHVVQPVPNALPGFCQAAAE